LLRQGATLENRASIVNITRVNALRPSGLRNYSYVAAKAGLGQLSVQLAADLMDEYVNVNVIAPGLFESKMTASLFESEEAVEQLLANQPMKRSGRMEDIAGLVIYLSSKAGQFITGSTIACDGGATSTT
jgi:NAD(P)-dependent dehydrogenase (short-subunit alcohol dehydrogenase family)